MFFPTFCLDRVYKLPTATKTLLQQVQILPTKSVGVVFFVLRAQSPDLLEVEVLRVSKNQSCLQCRQQVQKVYTVAKGFVTGDFLLQAFADPFASCCL